MLRPTLLVWRGGANPIVPVVAPDRVAGLRPVAILELEGAGHLVPLERAAPLAAAISRLAPYE